MVPERFPSASEEEKGEVTKSEGLDLARQGVNRLVAHELPKSGYESTMKVYGGQFIRDGEGKMVYDPRDAQSAIVDIPGDRVLRAFDEHHIKEPGKMFRRHPELLLQSLPFKADAKRYRGTMEQTYENIKKFGLEEMYGLYKFPELSAKEKLLKPRRMQEPYGIEVKQPEVFKNAVGLQDIFRADKIVNAPELKHIDRFDALGKATDYMRELHEKTGGGIGEGNTYMFLFTEKEDTEVAKPILMIPTEIWNPEKKISPIEQKTTDLLDLLVNAGFEEFRRSKGNIDARIAASVGNQSENARMASKNSIGAIGEKNAFEIMGDMMAGEAKELRTERGEIMEAAWESTRKALQTILEHYGDPKVITMAGSYIKRGRLTLLGDTQSREHETSGMYNVAHSAFALHNAQRLTADPEISARLREEISDVIEEYEKRG